MLKKCKIVMLPTNEKSSIINLDNEELFHIDQYVPKLNKGNTHLYIISDDEIKEGDWFINNYKEEVFQCVDEAHAKTLKATSEYGWKKIIATTNTSLFIETPNQCDGCKSKIPLDDYIHRNEKEIGMACSKDKYRDYLPQPSQQFIQKYIEEYNKGNIIDSIMVEYELISNEEYFLNTINPDENVPYFDENLKINPKDNSLNIKKIKDSYTREEVIEFGNKVKEYCKDGWKPDSLHRVFFEWDKWIEENL